MALKTGEKLTIAAAVSLAAYWFYSKSRALGSMLFLPGGVTGITMTGGAPIITFTIIAQNTSTSSLEIRSFAALVYSKNTLIGNVYSFEPVVIPANSQTLIPVQASLQVIGVVSSLVSAFSYRNVVQKITIDGNANVNGIQLPVKLDLSVGV